METLRAVNIRDLGINVLVVDDEEFNLEIISELLEDVGYCVETAVNGVEACALLEKNPDKYSAVMLDRMMPEMDGIAVMKHMKETPHLSMIPVIMQTAKATKQDIAVGLNAGVMFYITKPFNESTLLDIVDSAVASFLNQAELDQGLIDEHKTFNKYGQYVIHTMDEARQLATVLAHTCPEPRRVVVGLAELLVNAVEHGNLAIGYSAKTKLLAVKNAWRDEITKREALPENQNKKVLVTVMEDHDTGEVIFTIKDEGDGFDSERFLYINPERATSIHGRGIAIANMVSFDKLEYSENGSKVIASVDKGGS